MLGSAFARRQPPRSPTSALVSTSVRTLSSKKNGLPSVRSIKSCLSGGVGLRGVESLSRRRRGRHPRRVRTLGAELRRRRQLPTALGARPSQRRGAFLAELRTRLVLVLAPGTLHRPDLPNAVRSVYCRAKSGPSVPGGSQRVKDRRAGENWCVGRLLNRSGFGSVDTHFHRRRRRTGFEVIAGLRSAWTVSCSRPMPNFPLPSTKNASSECPNVSPSWFGRWRPARRMNPIW
jgi:hypothetical protein